MSDPEPCPDAPDRVKSVDEFPLNGFAETAHLQFRASARIIQEILGPPAKRAPGSGWIWYITDQDGQNRARLMAGGAHDWLRPDTPPAYEPGELLDLSILYEAETNPRDCERHLRQAVQRCVARQRRA